MLCYLVDQWKPKVDLGLPPKEVSFLLIIIVKNFLRNFYWNPVAIVKCFPPMWSKRLQFGWMQALTFLSLWINVIYILLSGYVYITCECRLFCGLFFGPGLFFFLFFTCFIDIFQSVSELTDYSLFIMSVYN